MQKLHGNHGRDHRANGADPIPGLTATTYAWLGRTSNQTFTTATPASPDWTASDTNDTASFAPDTSSDYIEITQTGLYVAAVSAVWSTAFADSHIRLVWAVDTPHTPKDVPEEDRYYTHSKSDVYLGVMGMAFVTALTGYSPPYVKALVQQDSGTDKTLVKASLRVVRVGDV